MEKLNVGGPLVIDDPTVRGKNFLLLKLMHNYFLLIHLEQVFRSKVFCSDALATTEIIVYTCSSM